MSDNSDCGRKVDEKNFFFWGGGKGDTPKIHQKRDRQLYGVGGEHSHVGC